MLRKADILSCDPGGNGQVSFGYRDSRSGKIQVRTPSGADFLHPNKKGLIALLHLVLRITLQRNRTELVQQPVQIAARFAITI